MLRTHNRTAAVLLSALLLAAAAVLNCDAQERGDSIAPFDLPFGIAVADLNGDGLLDIAVAEAHISGAPPHPGFVSVILQNPKAPGKFLPAVRYPAGGDPLGIAIGDLNGDGKPDLAVTNSTGGTLSLLMQDPANPGEFLPQIRVQLGGFPDGVVIGDIDGDGRPDIAVGAGTARIKILYQDSSSPPGTFHPPVTVPVKGGAWELALGDLNGDGVPDLVFISNVVSVILQDPAHRGTFLPQKNYRAGLQPDAVSIGDLNGDGVPDLAVANYGSGHGAGGVSVLLQDTANRGNFLSTANYGVGAGATGIAIADLNGDGKLDVVTANNAPISKTGTVSVLTQKAPRRGKLVFSRKNYLGKGGPWSVAIGDLNGDGKPDLAVADSAIATVLLQRPKMPGIFFPPVIVGK